MPYYDAWKTLMKDSARQGVFSCECALCLVGEKCVWVLLFSGTDYYRYRSKNIVLTHPSFQKMVHRPSSTAVSHNL